MSKEPFIQCYPHESTFAPGDTLGLHVWTPDPEFRVHVFRQGPSTVPTPVWTGTWTKRLNETCVQGFADADWGWPLYDLLTIPPQWSSGVYIAMLESRDGSDVFTPDFTTSYGAFAKTIFVILPLPAPASTAKILYKIPLATFHAYNNGSTALDTPDGMPRGGSLYTNVREYLAPDGTFLGYRVTMRRPGGGTGNDRDDGSLAPLLGDPSDYERPTRRNAFSHWDPYMVSWLESNGYAVDYCTDLDVHQDHSGKLLDPLKYRLLLSAGHDEYWSQEMRDHVSSFLHRGGNVAFFCGNLLPWRIHFCDGDTAFYCNKGVMDPLQGFINGPDLWWRLANPENTLTGVSLRNAGYVTQLHDPAGYRVQNSQHWVYAGTGLKDDDVFAADERLLSYEVDGARYTRESPESPAILDVRSRGATLDGTPDQFLILATFDIKGPGPAPPARNWYLVPRETPDGHLTNSCPDAGTYGATMGLYTSWGTVFAAGTTDWARVLVRDGNQTVNQITRNVVDGLAGPAAVVGVGDLNADGRPDLLLQHPRTNQLTYKLLNGVASVAAGAFETSVVSPDWRVMARADLGIVGDGKVALLWRSVTTRQLSYWLLDGTSKVQADYISVPGIAPSDDWNIVGVGRLHADSRTDIVWQSEATGQLSYWFMNGMARDSFGSITPVPDEALKVVAVADLNNDGFADLVLRHVKSNRLVIWYLNGTTMASSAVVTDSATPDFAPGEAWKVVGVGDFNADGQPDILFQNVDPRDADYGRLVVWFMSGSVRVGAAYLDTDA